MLHIRPRIFPCCPVLLPPWCCTQCKIFNMQNWQYLGNSHFFSELSLSLKMSLRHPFEKKQLLCYVIDSNCIMTVNRHLAEMSAHTVYPKDTLCLWYTLCNHQGWCICLECAYFNFIWRCVKVCTASLKVNCDPPIEVQEINIYTCTQLICDTDSDYEVYLFNTENVEKLITCRSWASNQNTWTTHLCCLALKLIHSSREVHMTVIWITDLGK